MVDFAREIKKEACACMRTDETPTWLWMPDSNHKSITTPVKTQKKLCISKMETVTAEPPIDGAVIESDFKVTLSATYLEDAVSHRHFEFNTTPQGVRTYRLFKLPVLQYLLYICFLLNILLALVETPARAGLEWPLWSTLLLEMICLTFFMARLFHEMLASVDVRSFWKDTKHVTNALIILLTLIDICVYVAMREGHPQSSASGGTYYWVPNKYWLMEREHVNGHFWNSFKRDN